MVTSRCNNVVKCVFVGNAGVGKTKIVMDMLDITYNFYNQTLGTEVHTTTVSGKKYNIWDTTGQLTFYGLLEGYYIGGKIFFIFLGGVGRTPQQWREDILVTVPEAVIYEVENPSLEDIWAILANH